MFWGLVVYSNKTHKKTVEVPFHITQAVLDKTKLPDNEFVQLILKSDGVDHILCKLRNLDTVQIPLNLKFCEGDEVAFRSVGGNVHLTGFYVDDDASNRYESDSGANDADERLNSDKNVQPPPAKTQKTNGLPNGASRKAANKEGTKDTKKDSQQTKRSKRSAK